MPADAAPCARSRTRRRRNTRAFQAASPRARRRSRCRSRPRARDRSTPKRAAAAAGSRGTAGSQSSRTPRRAERPRLSRPARDDPDPRRRSPWPCARGRRALRRQGAVRIGARASFGAEANRAPIDSQGVKAEAARRPRLVWAAGVVVMALAGLAGLGIFVAKQPFGFDLWAYVLAARHLLAGEPLYSAEPQMPAGPFGEYHYAPIVVVPFALLAPLPFWLATAAWTGLNTGIAAAIGVHLIRPLPHDARPWAAAAFV